MAVRTPDRHVTFGRAREDASILQCLSTSFTMEFSTTRPTVREAMGHASMRSSPATARWRRSRNARDAASKASHWAALAGNARAKIGRAPA